MTNRLIIFKLIGDFQQGFTVTVQIAEEGASISAGISGELPSCPELLQYYQKWQQVYYSLFSRTIKPQPGVTRAAINLDTTADAAFALQVKLNTWLNDSQKFRIIRERLKEILHRDDIIRVLLQTQNSQLQKLPWHLWDFFERYPNAELALSTLTFEPPAIAPVTTPKEKARILAILGNSKGIDIAIDRKLLQEKLADAEIVFLLEPSRRKLDEHLWDERGWDILFFAGHGETEGETGIIYVNSTESLTISQLNKALTKAIQRGLSLAIFNCCDGLGLAQQLSNLHLPQVVVMREPVADQVAQDFLKYFLHAFASGHPLYLAVRQAREALQGLENQFPCASWLPVLCQNPAVTPPRWIDLSGISDCPYKGLSAFREEDKSIFFGREDFIQRLLEALKNKPLVTVIGASGSGKSSVVFAGLIPHWRSLSTTQLHRHVAHFRPENNPFKNLAVALIPMLYPKKSEIDRQLAALELELHLESFVENLYNTIQVIVRQDGGLRLLLVVDQFEELYTLTPEEKRLPFLNALLYAVNKDTPGFNSVLTLRADFLGRALDYEPLGKALQKYAPELLIPMTDAQLEKAIALPANTLKVQLAQGLTKRIINDFKKASGHLPMLEFALTELWKKQSYCTLSYAAYEGIGGVQQALTDHAEKVYINLSEEEQKRARRVLLQLVQPPDETGTEDIHRIATRKIATANEIGEENWDLVTHFANERLVVTNERPIPVQTPRRGVSTAYRLISPSPFTSIKTVELIHEVLIWGWSRLGKWIEEDGDFRRWQERLRQAMREWESKHNRSDEALLQGAILGESEGWLQRSSEVGILEQEFIELSRSAQKRQQEKELRQEKKARRAERTRTSVAIASTILVSVAAIFAFNQWNQVQKQYENAQLKVASATASGIWGLDGLIETLKVGKKLQQLQQVSKVETDTRMQVVTALQKVVYGMKEQNRLDGLASLHSVSMKEQNRLAGLASVHSVSFSLDGQTIASAGIDKTVKLWKRDGSLIATLTGHSAEVNGVSFSPDGQIIASASDDKTVKLWKRDGSLITTMTGHSLKVRSVSFSPDGQTIASASDDKTVKLWRRDGTLITTFTGHSRQVNSVSFSPDGQIIASASDDKTVKLWKRDGSLITTLTGHGYHVASVSFSPDGQTIASASWDSTVKLWRRNGSLISTLFGHGSQVSAVRFSPDGNIASASYDHTVKLWRIGDGSLITTLIGHSSVVSSVSFSPDGQTIASASWDGTVRLWTSNDNLMTTMRADAPIGQVFAVSFSPDGQTIASTNIKTVSLWKRNGSLITTLTGHRDSVNAVSFSPDGQTIASASWDKTVKLWKRNGSLITTLTGHTDQVHAVSFSPDGQTIASGSYDNTVKLWRASDGSLITTLTKNSTNSDQVDTVSFSPDGQTIASGGFSSVNLWKRDGSLITTFGEYGGVNSVSFSPDGQTIASASRDKTVKLWKRNFRFLLTNFKLVRFGYSYSIGDDKLITTLIGHSADVTAVRFSPDGQTIASASLDNTIKLWKRDGSLITTLTGHGQVYDISFSPDGQAIASGGDNATVILWNLNLDDLLRRGCNWARVYLKNPNNGMSPDDPHRQVCDDVN